MNEDMNSVLIITRKLDAFIAVNETPISKTYWSSMPFDIIIDDRSYGFLHNGEKRYYRLIEGEHTLKLGKTERKFHVEKNQSVDFFVGLNLSKA